MLSDNIKDYYFVAQGKTSIPGVDDGEELELTDVRYFRLKYSKIVFNLCCIEKSTAHYTTQSITN